MARSPPPHTEAAIAAAAAGAAAAAAGGVTFGAARTTAGGGRPSLKRGGSTECRYGTGCKRLDCSFSHPQGERHLALVSPGLPDSVGRREGRNLDRLCHFSSAHMRLVQRVTRSAWVGGELLKVDRDFIAVVIRLRLVLLSRVFLRPCWRSFDRVQIIPVRPTAAPSGERSTGPG